MNLWTVVYIYIKTFERQSNHKSDLLAIFFLWIQLGEENRFVKNSFGMGLVFELQEISRNLGVSFLELDFKEIWKFETYIL